MPVIEDGAVAELWIPTADLPVSKPFGLTSSPDGTTLYVTCVGNGANGVVVAIDISTKAQTVISNSLQYVRHGIDVDASGNVYFLTGPNPLAAGGVTLHRWDGSTISTPWGTNVFGGMFGMCIGDDDKLYVEERNSGSRSWFARRTVGFAQEWWQPPYLNDGLFDQCRGLGVTTDYLLAANSDDGNVWIQDRATGVGIGEVSGAGVSGAPHGIHVESDTEVYVLTQHGDVWVYNSLTGAQSPVDITDLPFETTNPLENMGPYADIHITSLGQVFITRGGWTADEANPSSQDSAHGTDVGIYIIGELSLGWQIGRVGRTW